MRSFTVLESNIGKAMRVGGPGTSNTDHGRVGGSGTSNTDHRRVEGSGTSNTGHSQTSNTDHGRVEGKMQHWQRQGGGATWKMEGRVEANKQNRQREGARQQATWTRGGWGADRERKKIVF